MGNCLSGSDNDDRQRRQQSANSQRILVNNTNREDFTNRVTNQNTLRQATNDCQNCVRNASQVPVIRPARPITTRQQEIKRTPYNSNCIELLDNPKLTYNNNLRVSDDDQLYGCKIYIGRLAEKLVLVKSIKKEHKTEMETEIKMLSDLSHVNIANIIFKLDSPEKYFIITENYGTVLNESSVSGWSELTKKKVMLQLMDAMKYLQDKKILHNNISPRSVFVNNNNNPFVPSVRLFNFHKAKELRSFFTTYTSHGKSIELNNVDGYSAPEFFRNVSCLSSDIYSLGCLYFFIMTKGLKVYQIRYEHEEDKLKARINSMPNNTVLNILSKDLISKMVVHSPNDRLSANDAKDHPFFWSANQTTSFIIEISKLIEKSGQYQDYLFNGGKKVIHDNWILKLDDDTLQILQDARQAYQAKIRVSQEEINGKSILSLVKTLRNILVHAQDDKLNEKMGSDEDFVKYWNDKFPLLILHLYKSKLDFENKVMINSNNNNNNNNNNNKKVNNNNVANIINNNNSGKGNKNKRNRRARK